MKCHDTFWMYATNPTKSQLNHHASRHHRPIPCHDLISSIQTSIWLQKKNKSKKSYKSSTYSQYMLPKIFIECYTLSDCLLSTVLCFALGSTLSLFLDFGHDYTRYNVRSVLDIFKDDNYETGQRHGGIVQIFQIYVTLMGRNT